MIRVVGSVWGGSIWLWVGAGHWTVLHSFMGVESGIGAMGTPAIAIKYLIASDQIYNYARVLCHYGAHIFEFRDAVAEGDGERVYRCWQVMLPHFLASR